MILVYSAAESPRLTYVLGVLGRELSGAPLSHTTDQHFFLASQHPKLQYGGERLTGVSFYLPAVALLFEKDLRPQHVGCMALSGMPFLFPGEGDMPFDLFAAIFFLLSRYEEWLPYTPDEFGRFPPESSLASRNHFLQRPLIDEWLQLFQTRLAAVFPGLRFRKRFFSFLATYDIDMARSFSGKGLPRNGGGLVRDLFTGRFAAVKERTAVLSGARPDPFDSFSWLDDLHDELHLQPYYFLLLAARRSGLDKNLSPSAAIMEKLCRQLAGRYRTGIHPSYRSGDDAGLLKEEVVTLARLSGKPVTCSRQHYLRLAMPVTFRRLLEAGITRDFSMGYGSRNGFRASYTGDFFWYDLEKDEETPLLLTPFCFMDATAFYGEGKDATAALEQMRLLRDRIANTNGRMTTLWHNHFLGTAPGFSGWREIYGSFVRETMAQAAPNA